jgi:hypothetical protein
MKKQITFLLILVFTLFSTTAVFAQPGFTNLYLIGNASPSGWNIGTPVAAMVQDLTDANVFTWEGPLTAGELKISTFTGNWCDGQWLNASEANGPITATSYIYTTGCDGPDNKWLILPEEAGNYKITINLMNETIIFLKQSNDASLASLSLSTGLLSPLFDGAITEYTASVPNGTTSVDITAQPNDMYAGLTGAGTVDVSSGAAVASIIVTSADGSTKLTYTINIKVSDPYFSNLYLIGSATPNGWNIATPEAMTHDEVDTMIFTWEGSLIAGEFKMSTFTGDWCDGIWIVASQPDQVLFATDYMYRIGCDGADNKWVVSVEAEGYYIIRVNLRDKSISIENQMHDAELASLSLSVGTLSPVFDGLVTEYSAELPFGTTSVNVTAVERSMGAVVAGVGSVDVSSGSGKATIVVTAPDEYLTKTYTVDFTVSTSSTVAVKNSESLKTSVYPNPASEILYVNMGSESKGIVLIYSIDGRELYRSIQNECTSGVNLAKLNTTGYIFVKVITEKSNEVFKVVLK